MYPRLEYTITFQSNFGEYFALGEYESKEYTPATDTEKLSLSYTDAICDEITNKIINADGGLNFITKDGNGNHIIVDVV